MTNFRRWDIILVKFPFTDFSSFKKRPALIISPSSYNRSDDFVIVFMTSNINSPRKLGDVYIKHWKESGLPKPSLIRMKFATINDKIIIKKIGRLKEFDKNIFLAELKNFFFTGS